MKFKIKFRDGDILKFNADCWQDKEGEIILFFKDDKLILRTFYSQIKYIEQE